MAEDIRYEERVLAALLKYPAKGLQHSLAIAPDYFLNPYHRRIYDIVMEYADHAKTVPTEAILNEILTQRMGSEAGLLKTVLTKVLAEPLTEDDLPHLSFYVHALEERWMAWTAKQSMTSAVGKLETGDVRGAYSVLQSEVRLPTSSYIHGELNADFASAFEEYRYRSQHPEIFKGIPIGFPFIDVPSGGHHKKEFIVVVAGTGVGKSLVLGQVALNVARQGKKVLLVTIENDKTAYMNRLYSNIARIPYSQFKQHRLTPQEEAHWAKSVGQLGPDFYLKTVEFPEGCCVRDIWKFMRNLPEKIDYLVVDQITNMVPNNPKEFRNMDWRFYGQIALELKRLGGYAYDNEGLPVLSAVHAAGGTLDKKELTTDDMALAKIIQYHAHAALFVTRPEGDYQMGASKYRDAKIETTPVFVDFNYWTIQQTPPEERYGRTIADDIEAARRPDSTPFDNVPDESLPPDAFDFDPVELEREQSKEDALAERLATEAPTLPFDSVPEEDGVDSEDL